jgi:hypothetical protein
MAWRSSVVSGMGMILEKVAVFPACQRLSTVIAPGRRFYFGV